MPGQPDLFSLRCDPHVILFCRRCPACHVRVPGGREWGYTCDRCGVPAGIFSAPRRCPFCFAVASYDASGALICSEGEHRVSARDVYPAWYDLVPEREKVAPRDDDHLPGSGVYCHALPRHRWPPAARARFALDEAEEERHRRGGARKRIDVLHGARRELARLGRKPAPEIFGVRVDAGVLRALAIMIDNERRDIAGEDRIRSSTTRSEPFSGYRHALARVFNGHAGHLGRGNVNAGIERPQALHGLPGGVLFNKMAVAPSKNGRASASGEGALLDKIDADEAFQKVRVGGVWYRLADSDASRCEGGRPLTPVEVELLRLCDHGDEVVNQIPYAEERTRRARGESVDASEFRPLKPIEALTRLKSSNQRRAFPSARHLQVREVEQMLRAARAAVIEAFVALGLIPRPQRRPRAVPPEDTAVQPPSPPAPLAWDYEAPTK